MVPAEFSPFSVLTGVSIESSSQPGKNIVDRHLEPVPGLPLYAVRFRVGSEEDNPWGLLMLDRSEEPYVPAVESDVAPWLVRQTEPLLCYRRLMLNLSRKDDQLLGFKDLQVWFDSPGESTGKLGVYYCLEYKPLEGFPGSGELSDITRIVSKPNSSSSDSRWQWQKLRERVALANEGLQRQLPDVIDWYSLAKLYLHPDSPQTLSTMKVHENPLDPMGSGMAA